MHTVWSMVFAPWWFSPLYCACCLSLALSKNLTLYMVPVGALPHVKWGWGLAHGWFLCSPVWLVICFWVALEQSSPSDD